MDFYRYRVSFLPSSSDLAPYTRDYAYTELSEDIARDFFLDFYLRVPPLHAKSYRAIVLVLDAKGEERRRFIDDPFKEAMLWLWKKKKREDEKS